MLIKLYPSHERLPSSTSYEPSREDFEPEHHRKLWVQFPHMVRHISDTLIWPILMGLNGVELPLLAHVSAFHRHMSKSGLVCLPERIQVEITNSQNTDSVWIEKSGKTTSPYQFPDVDYCLHSDSAEFWRDYFTKKC